MGAAPPLKLLLVDDEEDMLFIVGLAAEATGRFSVEKARDGKEALKKVFRFRPDVAVIDGLMPRMNGFELCRRLRADPRTKRLPIVILSAGEPVRFEAAAAAAGADRFVRKPYDQDDLMAQLLALGGGKAREPARRSSKRKSGGASGIRTRE